MEIDTLGTLGDWSDPAMVVVTAGTEDVGSGCLVGFHSQASIGPERYAVWLSKSNHTYQVALSSSHLAVHFLTTADLGTAHHFGELTGDDVDKLAGLALSHGPGGVPLLDACPNRLVMMRQTVLDDGGDHSCFVGEVVAVSAPGPFVPLRLSACSGFSPGHPADE